jgi:malate permease and related proteins
MPPTQAGRLRAFFKNGFGFHSPQLLMKGVLASHSLLSGGILLIKIFEITLPIFVIALVGFVYSRAARPNLGDANKMVVDLALPILIFTSLSAKSFDPLAALPFTLACILVILFSGVLALILAPVSGAQWRAFAPCTMFVNVGPVGIPLIVLAYGPHGLAPAVVLLVISNLLHFTIGTGAMSGKIDWRTLYANPLIWATFLGISGSQMQIALPGWLDTSLAMLGSVLVPMMLLALGARLSLSKFADVGTGVRSAVLIGGIRLVAALCVLAVVPLEGVARGALILFACMPPAVFNFMIADRYKVQPEKVASIVLVGHVASLALLPAGLWLALH